VTTTKIEGRRIVTHGFTKDEELQAFVERIRKSLHANLRDQLLKYGPGALETVLGNAARNLASGLWHELEERDARIEKLEAELGFAEVANLNNEATITELGKRLDTAKWAVFKGDNATMRRALGMNSYQHDAQGKGGE
jgi:hypothetical protein